MDHQCHKFYYGNEEKKILISKEWLTETMIDSFHVLLERNSNYAPRPVWLTIFPDQIVPLENPKKKHLQILHSDFAGGHWVTCHYDAKSVIIYDSHEGSRNANKQHLNEKIRIFVERLFPFHDFQNNPTVFSKVQSQGNCYDCGPIAIAYATSILFDINPCIVEYNRSLLRSHLSVMFATQTITHFPYLCSATAPLLTLLSLETLERREADALRKRLARSKETKETLKGREADTLRKRLARSKETEETFKGREADILRKRLLRSKETGETLNVREKDALRKRLARSKETEETLKGREVDALRKRLARSKETEETLKRREADALRKRLARSKETEETLKEREADALRKKLTRSKETEVTLKGRKADVLRKRLARSKKTEETLKGREADALRKRFARSKETEETLKEREADALRKKLARSKETEETLKKRKADVLRKRLARSKKTEETLKKREANALKKRLARSKETEETMKKREADAFRKRLARSKKTEETLKGREADALRKKFARSKETEETLKEREADALRKKLARSKETEETLKGRAADVLRKRLARSKDTEETLKGREADALRKRFVRSNEIEEQRLKRLEKDVLFHKQQYVKNAVSLCTQKRDKYKHNPELKRQMMRDKIRQRMRDMYKKNPERQCKRKRNEYQKNFKYKRDQKHHYYSSQLEYNRQMKRKNYSKNVARERDRQQKIRQKHPDSKKMYNKKCNAKRGERSIVQRSKTLERLKKKFNTVRSWQKCFNFPKCSEFYIRRMSRKINKPAVCARLEAEQIFKWCIIAKKSYVNAARQVFFYLKNAAKAALLRFNECKTLKYPKSDQIRALCGSSRHTSFSEAYFYETAYDQRIKFEQPLIMGQSSSHAVINVLPLIENNDKKSKMWHCDEKICYISDISVEKYVKFFKQFEGTTIKKIINTRFMAQLKNCSVSHTSSRLGHPPECYANPNQCKSYIATINTLSPHFPVVRNIRRNVYKLIDNYKKFYQLLSALKFVNMDKLLEISNDTKTKARFYKKDLTVSLDEEKILLQNYEAFKIMKKRLLDTPRFPCISCEKLCMSIDVVEVKKLRKTIEGPFWKDLMAYVTEYNNDTEFICKLCLNKFRKGMLPSTCILNNLAIKPLPDVLSDFNNYEKMLIKRMSSFQVVQTMGAVSNKHLPHRRMIRKVKGRTFHLPLPLQETLDKVCPPEDPINLNHELHILVRGIPKKSKVVWENLVDINKVYKALQWLKDNNPHYSEIRLPVSSDELLNDKLQETEYQFIDDEGDEGNNDKIDEVGEDIIEQNKNNNNQTVLKHKAFLTQITNNSNINEQYTIYPMRVKRIDNKSALKLYQMLKIEDVPVDNRYKYLDVMCFPDLYLEGINEQREDRNFLLADYLFIRTRLMSKHKRFRLNLQYLFFLLNDANNRQLKNGIYYATMVANARERYTADRYLNELKDEQFESNLMSMFGKLRNTDQFWRQPSNNVKCMTLHYGPATWFLTLSPSEWKWSDLVNIYET